MESDLDNEIDPEEAERRETLINDFIDAMSVNDKERAWNDFCSYFSYLYENDMVSDFLGTLISRPWKDYPQIPLPKETEDDMEKDVDEIIKFINSLVISDEGEVLDELIPAEYLNETIEDYNLKKELVLQFIEELIREDKLKEDEKKVLNFIDAIEED